MKKLLSIFAAGALALGLIGCSGDLHDVSGVDLSTLQLKGSIFTWKSYGDADYVGTPDQYKFTEDTDGTYYYEFIATASSVTFAIDDVGADGKTQWLTTYRGTDLDELNKDFKDTFGESKTSTLYPHGDANCMPLALDTGATYRIIITSGPGNIGCTVKKVADAIPFAIVDDNGKSISMDATGATTFKYDFKEKTAGTLKFFVQSGTAYYAPAAETALTTTAAETAVSGTTDPAEEYYTFDYEADIPYKVLVEYNKNTGTISVAVKYGDLLSGYGVKQWYGSSWNDMEFTTLTRVSTTEWYWDVVASDAIPSYKFSIILGATDWDHGRWELDEKYTLELDKEIGPLNYNNEPTRATIDIPAGETYRFTLIDKDGTGAATNVVVKVTKL